MGKKTTSDQNRRKLHKRELDNLYRRFNHRCYVHPDPLEFLYAYGDVRDREIAALLASALAYGRVAQILPRVSQLLGPMGSSPRAFLISTSRSDMEGLFGGFVHRFARGEHIRSLLMGMRRVLREYGSLHACFLSGLSREDATVHPALCRFAAQLVRVAVNGSGPGHLVPDPMRGSACKRLNLFLRWMVRKDAVDPGGWEGISAARLIVPLDVHMHRFGLEWGFTARKQADMRTALEITAGFRDLVPKDPVRYDFAVTRPGILRGFLKKDGDFL